MSRANVAGASLVGTYLVLLASFLVSVYLGPYHQWSLNDTKIVTGEADISEFDGAHLPSMIVCHSRARSVPDERLKEIFITHISDPANSRPSSIFWDMEVKSSVTKSSVVVELGDPDSVVKPFLCDVSRCRICFELDLAAVVDMVKEERSSGDIKKDAEHGSTMTLNLVLSEGKDNLTANGDEFFIVNLVERGDGLMHGPPNLMAPNSLVIKTGSSALVRLKQKRVEMTRNCQPGDRTLSSCVRDYLDQEYGHCNDSQVVPSSGDEGCDGNKIYSRAMAAERLKLEGYEYIRERTGCQAPCLRFEDEMKALHTGPMALVVPGDVSRLPRDSVFLIVLLPRTRTMPRLTETKSYPFTSFVGEVGGYLGIFLGLSIWGIVQTASDAYGRLSTKETGENSSTPP